MQKRIYISLIVVMFSGVAASQNTVNSSSFRFDNEIDQTLDEDLDEQAVDQSKPIAIHEEDFATEYGDGFQRLADKSAGIAFGKVLSWQDYSLFLSYQKRKNLAFWVSNGFGNYEFRDSYEDIEYDLDIRGISLKGGARYYFLPLFPLYLQSSLGFSRLSGDIEASRTVDVEANPDSFLFSSDYSSLVVALDLNIGLQYVFSNGWYVDYTVVNLNASLALSVDVDTEDSQLEDAIKDKFNDVFQYGIFNIGVGYTW